MKSSSPPGKRAFRRARRLLRSDRFRHATSGSRILPDYIIIGAQRAGTTSLYDYLCGHPDVVPPTAPKDVYWSKELHFFDDGFGRGLAWYRACFPLAFSRLLARRRGRDLVTGEATPSYIFHPAAPGRVAATVPGVRLIALLRDPVERAYSHYQLMVRLGKEDLSFEEALAAEGERLAAEEARKGAAPDYPSPAYRHYAYVARGLYADQLERWLQHFPREQLLVVGSEEFRERTAEICSRVLEFIGLRPWEPDDVAVRNRASYAPIDSTVRAGLEQRFAEPNARLARLVGRDFGWDTTPSTKTPTRAVSARGIQGRAP